MQQMSRVEEIYFRAAEMRGIAERQIYLDEACGDDVQLRDRIDRMLIADAGSFLERPAIVPNPDVAHPTPSPSDTGPQPPSASNPTPSTTRYEIGETIGRGGMAQVLRSRDLELDRDVAIKILDRLPTPNGDSESRFLAEARISGRLQHPGIAPVYGIGRLPDQRPYIAMKLINGQTLAKLLASRSHPGDGRDRFLGIFRQICQTMAYAHSCGVVHRDLKPANIMVGEFGEVQVMDWGLAKNLNELPDGEGTTSSRLSEATIDTDPAYVMGTPAYLAPEQARRDGARSNPRLDVFGLGGLLCEILTGHPPFYGAPVGELLHRSHRGDLSDAFSRLDQCEADGEVVALAKACLQSNPEDRPPDGKAVADAMAAYLDGVQQRLRDAEFGQIRAQTQALGERRRRRLTVALAATLVVIAVGGMLILGQFQRQRDRQRELVSNVESTLLNGKNLLDQGWIEQDADRIKRACAEFENAFRLAQNGSLSHEISTRASQEIAEGALVTNRMAANQKLINELTELGVPLEFGSAKHLAQINPLSSFHEAFGRWGFDVKSSDLATTVARFRQEPVAVRELIVAAIDHLALHQRRNSPDSNWREFSKLAEDLDDDPIRKQIRLRAFADVIRKKSDPSNKDDFTLPDPERQPSLTVLLLAKWMVIRGDKDSAERLLRTVLAGRPSDATLLLFLGEILQSRGPSQLDEAIGCYRAARATRMGITTPLVLALADSNNPMDIVEAEVIQKKLLEATPDVFEFHTNYGFILERLGRHREAEAAYRKTIELQPNNSIGYANLAKSMCEQKRYADAETASRRAIELDPKNVTAWVNLGVAMAQLDRYDAAESAFRQALKLQPMDRNARSNLTLLNTMHRRHAEMLESARMGVKTHPNLAHARFDLAKALIEVGKSNEAIAEFQKAFELGYDNAEIYVCYGNALFQLKRYDEACVAQRRAIARDPQQFVAYCNLGSSLFALKMYEEAINAFRNAARLNPDYANAHFGLGLVYRDTAQFAESIKSLQEAKRLNPKHSQTSVEIAMVYLRMRKFEEAERHFSEVVESNPSNTLYRNGLASTLFQRRKYQRAAEEYEKIVSFEPNAAHFLVFAGNARAALHDYSAAEKHYRQAMELAPNIEQYRFKYGEMLFNRGAWKEAEAALREAIRLNTNSQDAYLYISEMLLFQGRYSEIPPLWMNVPTEIGRLWRSKWINQSQVFQELEKKLPEYLQGNWKPSNSVEHFRLAQVLFAKGESAKAIEVYRTILKSDPKLNLVRVSGMCNPACVAVQQGSTQSRDLAMQWLRSDLAQIQSNLPVASPVDRIMEANRLSRWRIQSEMAPIRDESALAKLSVKEADEWRKFWKEVDETYRKSMLLAIE